MTACATEHEEDVERLAIVLRRDGLDDPWDRGDSTSAFRLPARGVGVRAAAARGWFAWSRVVTGFLDVPTVIARNDVKSHRTANALTTAAPSRKIQFIQHSRSTVI